MRIFVLQLVLVWSGLWPAKSLSVSEGYYLGWAEIDPIQRGIQVSFNPIDCNVCSFAVILPQENGVLVAHFDVSLIASDQLPEAQEGKIVARKATLIRDGNIHECPDPPCLVLGAKGDLLRIEVSSNRSLKPSELMLLTTDSVDRVSSSGLFEKVEVKARRTIEADPMRSLEPFKTSARNSAPVVERSQVAVKGAANSVSASFANQAANLAQPSVQIRSSVSQDIPTLARIWPTNKNVGLSGLCHVLLFYGLGPTDLPAFPSGELALKALTDEEAAIQTFGRSPFIRTRKGLRYLLSNDPVFHTDVGETHQDQCLATFAALDLPLDTPINLKSGTYAISDLFSESIANFSFDQKELAWTAIALAHYLPPKNEWVNRFREHATLSRLTRQLMQRGFDVESCAGIHVLQALAKIEQTDRGHFVLDNETRTQLDAYLTSKLQQAVERQQPDGAWNEQWCDAVSVADEGTSPFPKRFLVTGHLLEVMNVLQSSRRPAGTVYVRAAEWLKQSINSDEIRPNGSWVCPFTHGARAAREILRPAKISLSGADTFHHTE